MTEGELELSAGLVAAAAMVARPVSLAALLAALLLAGVIAVASVSWRRWIVVLALMVVVTDLAARAEPVADLPPSGLHTVSATLRTDPVERFHRQSFDARLDDLGGVHVTVDLDDQKGVTLSAGQRATLTGRFSRLDGRWEWRASRHLRWRFRADSAERTNEGSLVWRAANAFRGVLADSTAGWSTDERALFGGVVVGDDRDQSDLMRHRFRVSGLAHLLAVSGQNVAFLLAVATPLLARIRVKRRWMVAGVVLLWFALVTRLEPSVVRAVTMASASVVASALGRISAGRRNLAIAVIVLLVVDPMLVWSVGFRLSVVASWSVLTMSRPIGRRLRGPEWLRDAFAVTLAAQIGTAPLLLSLAGTVPLAGIVVNLAAVPVAGWLMVWGMTAMPFVGALHPLGAELVELPALLGTRFLSWVAEAGAARWWPQLGATQLLVLGGVAAAAGFLRGRFASPRTRRWLVAAVVAAVVATVCAAHPVPGVEAVASAGTIAVDPTGTTVVVIGGNTAAEPLLRALVRRRIGVVDLVVSRSAASQAATTIWTLRQAVRVDRVLVPPGSSILDSAVLSEGDIDVATLRVKVSRHGRTWRAEVASTGGSGGRVPG